MTIPESMLYPRRGDTQTIYLRAAISDPSIDVGEYTMYNDFVRDPRGFEKNNVLYHYPVNRDRLIIGRFCSIACGREVSLHQRQTYDALAFNVSLPHFL